MRYLKILVCVLALPARLAAQAPTLTIESALLASRRPEISVEFSHALDAAGPHTDPTHIQIRPTIGVAVSGVSRSLVEPDVLTVTFTGDLPVGTPVEICFDSVSFSDKNVPYETTVPVCRAVGTAAQVKEARAAALALLKAVPRASRDKDIFASGFVTTAADESAGGVDLSLNPDFKIPNLNSFLQIKKATADEGDARNFEAGVRYRYVRTWRPAEMRDIAVLAAKGTLTTPAERVALKDLIQQRQNNIMAGWLFDFAGKLEGDPTNFDVTNFVTESAFQLRTMTRGFLGRKGFWRGFLLPGGFELGQSVGTTVPAATGAGPAPAAAPAEVNRIGRYKAGAGFTLYYDNPGAALPLQRVEVDVNGVMRHLFWAESRFNPDTKKTDITADGLHGYAQVDLKVFFVQTEAGRYGFKLSFNRGRLPPVYSEVRSFDFGFVIESGDDDGKATAERRAAAAGRSRK